MIVMRRPQAPVRAQLRSRLSTFEQARVLRACHDIRELLRPLSCTGCHTEAPNARAARVEGWLVHERAGAPWRAECPACLAARHALAQTAEAADEARRAS